MKIRILKKPKEFIDGLTLKRAIFYLVMFSMGICFLLGVLVGVILT